MRKITILSLFFVFFTAFVVGCSYKIVLNHLSILGDRSVSMRVGEVQTFIAYGDYAQTEGIGDYYDYKRIYQTWSVSGEIGSIVNEMENNGNFTATCEGTGSVIICSEDKIDSISVRVTDPDLSSIESVAVLPSSASLQTDRYHSFEAIASYKSGGTGEVDASWCVVGILAEIDSHGRFISKVGGEGLVIASVGTLSAAAAVTIIP